MRRICILAVLCAVIGFWTAAAADDPNETWTLSDVKKIRIEGVSGDVVILPADDAKGRVELFEDVRPRDSFEIKVKERNGTLWLVEKWPDGSSHGDVSWTIYLPKKKNPLSVRISTASGALKCEDVAVKIDFKTASGDIDLSRVELMEGSNFNTASGEYTIKDMTIPEDVDFSTASGDMELVDLKIGDDCGFGTASGDIHVKRCTCADDVDFSSASGDVVVESTELKGGGEFSSASGDVAVYLDELPENDIYASSASGNVTLDVKRYGDDFTLVLIKRRDKGRISCPFDYTEEDEFKDHQWYERKIVKKGKGGPTIKLRTASGKVVVKK